MIPLNFIVRQTLYYIRHDTEIRRKRKVALGPLKTTLHVRTHSFPHTGELEHVHTSYVAKRPLNWTRQRPLFIFFTVRK